MPGKSKYGKGKHSLSKRKKGGLHLSASATEAQVNTPTQAMTLRTQVPISSVSPTKQSTAQYPYIITELKTIAILAAISMAILVILALLLS